ncbi:hypothetical protein, partial [Chromobacterium amazonense]|uniref:hypothetical protein n=1 Tax=Chromobacterium amazonense TaxID=1382803 RepID=UPI003F79FD5A
MKINHEKWVCAPKEKDGLIIFVQRTREILLHSASITSKPLSSSVPLIVQELEKLTLQQSHDPHSSFHKQMEIITEELVYSLKNDEISKELAGDRIDHILRNLRDEKINIQIKIESAQFLKSRIKRLDYFNLAKSKISEIILNDSKEKERLIKLTESAISAIINAGYPSQTIYHLLNITFLNKNNEIQ